MECPLSDIHVKGRSAVAHSNTYARGETVQVLAVFEGVRQFQLLVPAHADSSGYQAVPLRDLSAKVHAVIAPPAAHPDAYG